MESMIKQVVKMLGFKKLIYLLPMCITYIPQCFLNLSDQGMLLSWGISLDQHSLRDPGLGNLLFPPHVSVLLFLCGFLYPATETNLAGVGERETEQTQSELHSLFSHQSPACYSH